MVDSTERAPQAVAGKSMTRAMITSVVKDQKAEVKQLISKAKDGGASLAVMGDS